MAGSDGMVRTQIQLEVDRHRRLRALGAKAGKGLAEQVREAVGEYLVRQGAKAEPLAATLGKFRPKAAGALKEHDRDFADTLR